MEKKISLVNSNSYISNLKINNLSTKKENKNLDNNEKVNEDKYINDFLDLEYADFNSKKGKEISDNDKKEKIDLIKLMTTIKPKNKETWMSNLTSFFSSFYKNFTFNKKLTKVTGKYPLIIFDNEIKDNNQELDLIIQMNTFLYMSYRRDFTNLNNLGCGNFTSDCCWGCMIRCCQMLLSKGIIKKKLAEILKNTGAIKKDDILNARKETLTLFNDNYLPFDSIRNNIDFNNYFKKFEELIRHEPDYLNASEIIPPFSIHILCKLGECAGKYTSDIKMINTFMEINRQLFQPFIMSYFECGYISKQKLIETFCESLEDLNEKIVNKENIISYNKIDYVFKNKGLVFISFRLGLKKLDSLFYQNIPLLFKKIHNNIGFVCGFGTKAYYFIGVDANDKLIFVDPHSNQKTTDNNEKKLYTYFAPELYLMSVKNLSSELTLGIGVFSPKQFNFLLNDLSWFNDNIKDFITFK